MTNDDSLIILVATGEQNVWIKKDAGKVTRFFNEVGKGIRDVGRGVREHTSPLRWMGEKLFSGYGEQMEQLRQVDEQIQKWTRDLDNALNHAKDARKQGRLLDVFFWVSQINNRLRLATEAGQGLVDVSNEQINKYYGKTRHGLQPDYLAKLKEEDIIDPNQTFASQSYTSQQYQLLV